ncbi:MAG: hypothetical protein Q8N81_07165, partial [bacterium]|nr:hypothetical protein [bacterium]
AVAPRLRRDDIIDILLKTAIPLDDTNPDYRGKLGRGKVNSQAAVALAAEKAKRTIKATLAVSGEAGPPRVWLFNDQGTLISGFLAYDEAFRGGVRLASGDVDNDNEVEIITAPGPGVPAQIRIFEGRGSLKDEFLAFEDKNGVFVAAGNLVDDQAAEIVVAAGPGSTPRVRVFDHTGQLRSEFLAYDQSFTGGVEVSVGDTDGDGTAEIITGVHGQGGPHIRIFDWRGNLKGQFFAFEETYGNGVRLGMADVGGAVGEEILVTRGGGETARLHELRFNGNSWNSILVFAEDQDGPISIAARKSTTHVSELFVAGGKKGQFPLIHGFTPIGALISSFPVPVELGTSLHLVTL